MSREAARGPDAGSVRAAPFGPLPVPWGNVLFFGLAAFIVVADQITKAWVNASFPLVQPASAGGSAAAPTQVLGEFVEIAKIHNNGAIFGLFGASAPIFALASLAVIGIILWYQLRRGASSSVVLTVALSLLLGGALGNLIDRLRQGYVIDFMDMGIGTWRWYTFNVADASISVSIVLLLLVSLLSERLEGAGGPPTPTRPEAP